MPNLPDLIAAPMPRWVAPLYFGLAFLLVPWIIYLGVVLPDHTTSRHWDVAWVGFDAFEFAALVVTAWLAYRRSAWVASSAAATAALLFIDAWFDITTASGWNLVQAIGSAVLLELPLAALSVWIAKAVGPPDRRGQREDGLAS
ncbi:MAG TPA: hypothetical protein VG650_07090 [Mycobacteriales bacterium]|nr:hypothetical protein [Mycobacteriales bacterium]